MDRGSPLPALPGLTRRAALKAGGALALTGLLPAGAHAQTTETGPELHGLSAFGDLKYAPDFPAFDYVSPDAPKGGTFSQIGPTAAYNQSFNTFNSLNGYILKGDGAQGLDLIFDSLMVRAFDEPDAVYGLLARSVAVSADGTLYRFRLRPEARFHDGSRLTSADVAFSLLMLKLKGHPIIAQQLRDMTSVAAEGEDALAIRFAAKRARDVPLYVATLPVFSKAYYAGRPFDQTTMEPPLGSGPYRIGRFEAGRFIAYERVADYWGRDLPVNRGINNFDVLRFEYFRDRDIGFEAFKAKSYLFRQEFTSRTWATGYDFPAFKDGRVKRESLPDQTPSGAQGWFLNLRRPQFSDRRVREALSYAFDFEWTNRNLMFGLYERTTSFFENSELKAEGPAGPDELALIETVKGKVPPEVYDELKGEPWSPPVSDGSGQDRALLRHAVQLLREAGWSIRDGRLANDKGQPFTLEFLDDEGSLERHTAPFIKNLGTLGIAASFRVVDPAQYQQRLKEFDFDATVRRFSVSTLPGEALRAFFGSRAAATPGSNNLSGIASPAVDALVETVIAARSRDELRSACRALDRLLRAGRYWVPQWYSGQHRIAYWNVFARPDKPAPRYDRAIPSSWWAKPDAPEPEPEPPPASAPDTPPPG
ncbi:extracellular solute-binding protein [Ancylobacter sp. 6x-1]|uniref:Extracellular solute-binding protein n=1 Tax=Ancylobacter crimeensis TaxID=2579147 RepID=A0ABT0DAY0_9HYPH|nr:extracellular solute-binding protein [Ancylobacter crimeensis]MCK0197116.1 extracellular solute-binding protein [Ancylobacter crimeensis]